LEILQLYSTCHWQLVVLTSEFDRLVWDRSQKNVLKQEHYKVVGTQELAPQFPIIVFRT